MNKRTISSFYGLIILFNLLLLNCQASTNNPDNIITQTKISDKTGMTVKGQIVDNNNQPIAGVVLNDGQNFTVSDKHGIYYLPSDLTHSKYVSISIPNGFEIEKDVVSSFYSKLSTKEQVNRKDFRLNKRTTSSDEFVYIAISDPQVKTSSDVSRLDKESITDIKASIQQNSDKDVYAMTLGDNVFDRMNLFPVYKTMLSTLHVPVFSTIGNHDFDLMYSDLHNSKDPLSNYAEETYESFFGPTDYSFNIGKVHIISMKNIDYLGGKKYTECFTPEQLEWLKKDLSYVTPNSTIFLNLHAPTSNKSSNGSGNTRNAAELLEILKGYQVHIFAGHTHFYENE